MDESDGTSDSVLKHKLIWATYNPKWKKEKKGTVEKKKTRFVLSLVDMDEHLMMEDESLVWTSKDVVIVLQHQNDKMPLRGTQYMHVLSQPFTGSARHQRIISSYVLGLFENINRCALDPTRMRQLSIYFLSILIPQLYGVPFLK